MVIHPRYVSGAVMLAATTQDFRVAGSQPPSTRYREDRVRVEPLTPTHTIAIPPNTASEQDR